MQKWEYLSMARSREFDILASGSYVYPKKWKPENLDAALNELGRDGWELVAVTTRSDYGSEGTRTITGATTTEVFLFKRPKS